VNHVGYASAMGSLDGWRDALAQLLARAEARARGEEDGEERRTALPPLERIRSTVDAWARLAPRLAPLAERRDLGAWCGWVVRTLEDGEWGIGERLAAPCDDEEVWRTDLRARDAIAELAATWRKATHDFGHQSAVLDARAFADRFQLMLAQDLITAPSTDFGVIVAEALAAGWRSVAHVFVVGLSSGAFPRRPSPGPLFDPAERRALAEAGLALDPVDAWRERERALFRVLCAGARESLTLSWPAMDAEGREVARSAYVDEAVAVLARREGILDRESPDEALAARGLLVAIPTHEQLVPGFPVVRDAAALSIATGAAAREDARDQTPSPWNGRIEDPALVAELGARYGERYQWSATQLEEAAKCRWHWFANRQLRLEARADADDLMEPTTRGSILHDALDRFFAAAADVFGSPVHLRAGDAARAQALLRTALDEAWAAMDATGTWLGPIATRAAALAELADDLRGYLEFEIEWNEKSYAKSATKPARQRPDRRGRGRVRLRRRRTAGRRGQLPPARQGGPRRSRRGRAGPRCGALRRGDRLQELQVLHPRRRQREGMGRRHRAAGAALRGRAARVAPRRPARADGVPHHPRGEGGPSVGARAHEGRRDPGCAGRRGEARARARRRRGTDRAGATR
jgi:hypothetical protein